LEKELFLSMKPHARRHMPLIPGETTERTDIQVIYTYISQF